MITSARPESQADGRVALPYGRGSLRRSCAVSLGVTCSLRRPGTFGLIAGWGPAASDLTARYKDVRTRLDGLSIVPLFRVSVSVSRGAAIKRYPRRSPGYYRFEPMIFRPVSST